MPNTIIPAEDIGKHLIPVARQWAERMDAVMKMSPADQKAYWAKAERDRNIERKWRQLHQTGFGL